jgi:exoribonuclease R
VAHDVRLLHTLSQRIRQKRFATGSLRLDNTKILFRMDGQGNPCEALPYITKDSNHLVHPNPNP